VRDLSVQDRITRIDYRRVGPLPLPKSDRVPISAEPNRWMAAPGLEYLELWQGDKRVQVAFDGAVTRWQGRRNAFAETRARICRGNTVPMADLSFSYYVGRFGQYAGLSQFLALPDTRLVKANKRVNEILCHRVAGLAEMDLDGAPRRYSVTIDLAPQYGWLPIRARFADAESGHLVRDYRARSFFNLDTFPFPKEAQIDIYEVVPAAGTTRAEHAQLTQSLACYVDAVAVNRGVGPADFSFPFEPGAEVRDERTGETYVVPAEPEPGDEQPQQ